MGEEVARERSELPLVAADSAAALRSTLAISAQLDTRSSRSRRKQRATSSLTAAGTSGATLESGRTSWPRSQSKVSRASFPLKSQRRAQSCQIITPMAHTSTRRSMG